MFSSSNLYEMILPLRPRMVVRCAMAVLVLCVWIDDGDSGMVPDMARHPHTSAPVIQHTTTHRVMVTTRRPTPSEQHMMIHSPTMGSSSDHGSSTDGVVNQHTMDPHHLSITTTSAAPMHDGGTTEATQPKETTYITGKHHTTHPAMMGSSEHGVHPVPTDGVVNQHTMDSHLSTTTSTDPMHEEGTTEASQPMEATRTTDKQHMTTHPPMMGSSSDHGSSSEHGSAGAHHIPTLSHHATTATPQVMETTYTIDEHQPMRTHQPISPPSDTHETGHGAMHSVEQPMNVTDSPVLRSPTPSAPSNISGSEHEEHQPMQTNLPTLPPSGNHGSSYEHEAVHSTDVPYVNATDSSVIRSPTPAVPPDISGSEHEEYQSMQTHQPMLPPSGNQSSSHGAMLSTDSPPMNSPVVRSPTSSDPTNVTDINEEHQPMRTHAPMLTSVSAHSSHIPTVPDNNSTVSLNGSSEFNQLIGMPTTESIHDSIHHDAEDSTDGKLNNILIVTSFSFIVSLFTIMELILRQMKKCSITKRCKQWAFTLKEERLRRRMKNKKRHRHIEIRMPSIRKYMGKIDASTDTSDLSELYNNNNATTSKQTHKVTIETGALQKRVKLPERRVPQPPRIRLIDILSNSYFEKWAMAFDNSAFEFNPRQDLNFRRSSLPLSLYKFRVNQRDQRDNDVFFDNTKLSVRSWPTKEALSTSLGDVNMDADNLRSADDMALQQTSRGGTSSSRGSKRKRSKYPSIVHQDEFPDTVQSSSETAREETASDNQKSKRYHPSSSETILYDDMAVYDNVAYTVENEHFL